jgi:hypothetical protein
MTKTTTPATKAVPGLRVVSKSPMGAFRRCGRTFGADPVEIPLADLKKEEVSRLRAEPQLVCTDCEIKVADAKADGGEPQA